MTRWRALGCYAEHVAEREAIRPALQRASLNSLSSCAGVSYWAETRESVYRSRTPPAMR
jgi:hypothetical protein